MKNLNTQTTAVFQPYLEKDEQILWAEQPDWNHILQVSDAFVIPFGILWMMYVLLLVERLPTPFATLGLPYVLVGWYLAVGRLMLRYFLRRRTYYAVTNRRLLVVQHILGKTVYSVEIAALVQMTKHAKANDSGSLRFKFDTSKVKRKSQGRFRHLIEGSVDDFSNLSDVSATYDLIFNLRESFRAPTESIEVHA